MVRKKMCKSTTLAEVMKTYEEGVQEVEVKYTKRIIPTYCFLFEEQEIYTADFKDIQRKLPKRNVLLGTERTMTKLSSPVNFESYNFQKKPKLGLK